MKMRSEYVVLRMDKEPATYRFWFHDVAPEWDKFKSQEDWILDCLKNGFYIGLIGKYEETIKHI